MANPYLPPKANVKPTSPVARIRRETVALALIVAVVGGLLLGAVTNSINGYVSPDYFRGVMGWQTPRIWVAAIVQGAVEGLIYAVLGTILLLVAALIFTRCVLSTQIVVRLQISAFVAVAILWLVGGASAVVFAKNFPHVCDPRFFGYSTLWPEAGYYAWVRGSICGSVYGSIVAVLLSLALNRPRLREPTAS